MHRFSGFGNLEAISCHFLDLLGSGHRFQTNDVFFGEHAMSSIRNLDTERSLHGLSIFAMSAQRHKERWTGQKETQKQNLRLQNYQILWLSFSIRIFIPLIYIYTYILYHIISHRLKFQNLVRLHVGHVLIEGQTNHWELGPVNGTGEGDWRGRWDAQAFCKSWQVSSHSTSIQ